MTSGELRTAGVVLAAGLSSRMGRCKAMLDIGDRSALATVISSLSESDVEEIIVVTGYHREEVEKETLRCGARPVFNESCERGMFSSVLVGVSAISEKIGAFFLLPVDVPMVRPSTLQNLKSFFSHNKGLDVVFPSFLGKRGHPPLISSGLVPEILQWGGDGGLRGLLSLHEEKALTVEAPDEGIVAEMNTPEEYSLVKNLAHNNGVPSEKECLALWEIMATPEVVRNHCRTVAKVVDCLSDRLKDRVPVDPPLLRMAALLHDMARSCPDHAAKAALQLDSWGFSPIADLVRFHMELPEEEPLLSDRSLLFLADKVTTGNRVTGLDKKYELMEQKFRSDPVALESAQKRLRRARETGLAFEKASGASLGDVLRNIHP